MKKTKLTRSLLAACSIVALSAVMYGCVHSSDDPAPAPPVAPEPEPEPTPQVDVELPADIPAGYEPAAGEYVIAAGAYGGSNGVWFSCDAEGPDCTVTVHADGTATVTPDSGMVYTGLTDDAQAIVDAAIALAERQAQQRMALMMAAAAVDTSDLSTMANITAANAAIAALQMALDAAVDLSTADTAMYQTQLDNARTAVMTAQGVLDTQERMMAQRMAITNAVTMARTAVAGVDDDSTDSEVAAADSAVAMLEAAIEAAVDLPAGDADVASAMGTLTTLKGTLMVAKDSRDKAMMAAEDAEAKANAKVGKALHAALGPPDSTVTPQNALGNINTTTAPETNLSDGLTIDATAGAGTLTDGTTPTNPLPVTLKAGDSAGSLGGWMGTNYAHTNPVTGVVNAAVVYTNQDAPTVKPFATGASFGADQAAFDGAYTAATRTLAIGTGLTTATMDVAGDDFADAATTNHAADPVTGVATVRGTYQGAMGTYRCTPAPATPCSSTGSAAGVALSSGSWDFVHDAGAMTSRPDANYLYFGWWLSKDGDGVPTAASAFTGVNGAITALASGTNSPEDLSGSAIYAGHAAGKYAIYDVLDGTGHGGHFTADVELEATFGPIAAPNNGGISGTLDNFMAGGESMPWSVDLHHAPWGTAGAFASAAADNTNSTAEATVWSIDGNAAPESGAWMGLMYDEAPGNPPDGDGSTLPTSVTGTFYSEYTSIGRMVGAFGAEHQDD